MPRTAYTRRYHLWLYTPHSHGVGHNLQSQAPYLPTYTDENTKCVWNIDTRGLKWIDHSARAATSSAIPCPQSTHHIAHVGRDCAHDTVYVCTAVVCTRLPAVHVSVLTAAVDEDQV
jgi:hypothetical protein